jgi:uncharacterized protein YbjT (DUF2867 family)
MSRVLVTGGTGRLGRHLVPALTQRGHDVRVLSRRPGDGHVVGDLRDGTNLPAAVDGIEVVLHAATSARMKAVDLRGTARLLDAARDAGVRHVVYVSIVGVDRNPLPYYKIKLAAERAVAASGLPYTLARGTQFYDLVAGALAKAHVGPLLFAPKGWRLEPHAPVDFAAHLGERVDTGPAGAVTEFGGPEVLDVADLARDVHRAAKRTGRVRQLPVPGKASAAFAAGAQLCGPDAAHGSMPWTAWLAARR